MFKKCSCLQTEEKNEYVSCIKINGVPILPPLITPERSEELQDYKNQAIEIEKKLKCESILRSYIKTYYPVYCLDQVVSKTLESNLAHSEVPSKEKKTNSLSITNNLQNSTCRSLSTTQLTQQTNGEISLLNSRKFSLDLSNNKEAPNCDNGKINGETVSVLEDESPKPRLIRSNSYTLESPSPMLIECLQKKGELISAFDTNSSFSNNSKNDVNSERQKLEKISTNKSLVKSNSLPEKDDCVGQHMDFMTSKSPVKEHKRIEKGEGDNKETKTFNLQNNSNNNNNNIYDVYQNKIINMLDNYKKEQQKRMDSYTRLKMSLLGDVEEIFSPKTETERELIKFENQAKNSTDSASPPSELDTFRSNDLSVCFSDSFSNDVSSLLEMKTDLLIDFSENNQNQNNVPSHTINNWESTKIQQADLLGTLDSFQPIIPDESLSPRKNHNFFNKKTQSEIEKQRRLLIEERAATVICSAARGYLIRRLMKTERVQMLIQTIKDALLCAMELHTESLDKIRPADIELHRRLIQQVTAACYDFYDVFFSLTRKEQLSIIAVDRHKKKMKKPLLTPSSRKSAKIKNQVIISKYKRRIS